MIIVGHRGARNLWPENSLTGFRNTLALGVEAVEFDVHPTRDGKLVVIHDATLERTTMGQGRVAEHSLAELQATRLRDSDETVPSLDQVLDVLAPMRDSDETVPSLDQVLDVLAPSGLELQIELKVDADGQPYPGLENAVMAVVQRRGIAQRSILTCFVPQVLDRLHAQWPEIRLLASLSPTSANKLGGIDAALERFAVFANCLVAVEKSLLAAEYDRCVARLGAARLGVWTVNEPDELAFWIGKPIREITTDRPDLALAARRRAGR